MSKLDKELDKPCPYGLFLLYFPYCEKEVQDDLLDRLKQQPRPDKLCGVEVPQNLNAISYGTLDDLQTAANADDIAGEVCKILLNIEPDKLKNEDVNKVFGFTNFVTKQLNNINRLFARIKPNYSNEEKEAGIESLNFGSFGVLDWYAQRMHIANQNDVRDIAWVRIYQCMKNDNEKNEFERRLSEVYRKHSKHK